MIKLLSLSPKTCLDIPEALAVSELSERHTKELIAAFERLDLEVATIATDAPIEGVHRQMTDDLIENQLARVHNSWPPHG